jgi:hypothetical protein
VPVALVTFFAGGVLTATIILPVLFLLAERTGARLDLRWCRYIALIRKCCPCGEEKRDKKANSKN